MNEKEQITRFLRKFKIGDYMCSLRCDDELKWIDIDGYNNSVIFSTLGISDPDSFVEKFYNTSGNLCYWPPMDKDDDIENMLKLVFELYLRYEFKQLHIDECLMKIDICGIKLCFEKLDSLCKYCTSRNWAWPKIKHHLLNQGFPQVTFCKCGHTQITINKGKKKFSIPIKI